MAPLRIKLLVLLLLLASVGESSAYTILAGRQRTATAGPVEFTAAASGNNGTGGATLTYAFNTTACTNCVLVHFAHIWCSGTTCNPAATLTYDSEAATFHHSIVTNPVNSIWTYLWYQTGPNLGTHNVVVTTGISPRIAGGTLLFQNVDQTTPLGTINESESSAAGTISCTVTVPTDGMAAGGATKNDTTEHLVVATQTERYLDKSTNATAANNAAGAGATTATVGSQTFTFTVSPNRLINCIAVPINPV